MKFSEYASTETSALIARLLARRSEQSLREVQALRQALDEAAKAAETALKSFGQLDGTDDIAALVERLTAAAVAHTKAATQRVTADSQATIDSLRAEVQKHSEEHKALVNSANEARAQADALREESRTYTQRAEAARAELAKMREAHKRADAAREQAESARQEADAARQQAEAGLKKAEAARQQVEASWKKAEADRQQIDGGLKKAEAARQQAEASWKKAESERQQAEAAWKKVENERQQAEAGWKKAESERQQAEAGWKKADSERQQAEAALKKADAARQQAESAKQQLEDAWRQADAARKQAEAGWQAAEAAKKQAEAARQKAETARQQDAQANASADGALQTARHELEEARKDAARIAKQLEAHAAEKAKLTAALGEARAQAQAAQEQAAAKQHAAQQKRPIGAGAAPQLDLLLSVFQSLASGTSIAEVLTTVANGLTSDFSRIAAFKVNGNRLEGMYQVGFDFKSDISKIVMPLGVDSLLTQALTADRVEGFSARDVGDSTRAPFGGNPSSILALPIRVNGEAIGVVYADDSGRPAVESSVLEARVKFADLLRRQAVTTLQTLTIELKALVELRAYAKLLLDEVEYMYNADVTAGKKGQELQHRVRENVQCARQIYAQRVEVEGPAAAALLEERIADLIDASNGTSFGRDLAAASRGDSKKASQAS